VNRKHIGGYSDWSDDDEYSLLNSRFRQVVREHGANYRGRRGHRDTEWQDRRPPGPRYTSYRDRSF
jgi:hypothetical protein